ncbi:MAG: hypothetical protein LAQ30_32100, partial [Acidobacteriia bacterium]|nr:hypothetical protein [Terriglobia bacterium]
MTSLSRIAARTLAADADAAAAGATGIVGSRGAPQEPSRSQGARAGDQNRRYYQPLLRHTRMRQVGEQYWRSLLPALSRNHLPHPGAGHLAHRMMPVGRMSFIAYPGASHTYQYDDMGRLSTMDNGDTARATYGAAGEMLTLWMNGAGTETRTYNSLLQMTRQRTVGDDYLHTVLLDME